MKLQKDTQSIVSHHGKVPAKRAKEIVDFLTAQDADSLPRIVGTFRANDMPAAELALVEHLLGISEPVPATPAKSKSK